MTTLWTALLIALSGILLTAVVVWVVPVLVVLEGEVREERRSGSLAVGLMMGLIGVHVSLAGDGVRVRLLLFRRPRFVLPGRVGRPGQVSEGAGPQGREEAPAAPEARMERPQRREEVPPAAPERRTGRLPGQEERPAAPRPERLGRAGVMERLRTVRGYVRRFRGPAMRFLRTFRRAFRLRRATSDLVFGTGDPATTGQIAGVVYAVRPLLGPRVRIDMSPNFLARTFEAQGSLAVSVGLARVTYAVARLTVVVGGMLGWQYVRRRWAGWMDRRQQAVRYSV